MRTRDRFIRPWKHMVIGMGAMLAWMVVVAFVTAIAMLLFGPDATMYPLILGLYSLPGVAFGCMETMDKPTKVPWFHMLLFFAVFGLGMYGMFQSKDAPDYIAIPYAIAFGADAAAGVLIGRAAALKLVLRAR